MLNELINSQFSNAIKVSESIHLKYKCMFITKQYVHIPAEVMRYHSVDRTVASVICRTNW